MTTAIMLSFVIPAIVAVTLTVLLIKERDYLFKTKHSYRSTENRSGSEKHQKIRENNDRDRSHLDFSGGLMGI